MEYGPRSPEAGDPSDRTVVGTRVQDHSYREGVPGSPILMLSVAGQREEAAGRPAAGAARRHLDAILARLHDASPDISPFADADSYTILNAHPGVEYEAATGRTEAPVREYVTAVNLARVQGLVDGRPVIALGARARRTCRAARIHPVATGRHPSSLNRLGHPSIDAPTPAGRASQRYDIAALEVLRSLR